MVLSYDSYHEILENEKQKNLELQMMKERMTKQQESMKKHDDTMVKILQKV